MGGGISKIAALAAVGICLFGAMSSRAEGQEHKYVLEIGPAGEWPVKDKPNFGGNFAIESTFIENWLEIEVGLTSLATNGRTEWSGDLLFKKPFRVSPTFEFMIGAGPSISKNLVGDRNTDVSAALALDFMFWPTPNIGWFVEPTWSINPRNGEQSFAATAGILIGVPEH
jgi:hypothetical protein